MPKQDRRRTKFTVECLSDVLKLPGYITHVEMNHNTGVVCFYFQGDGTVQTTEGENSKEYIPKRGK